jgi:hypothetical protein
MLHYSSHPCAATARGLSAVVLQLDDSSVRTHGLQVWSGSVLLALWFVVLVVTLVLGATLASPPPPLQWWQVSAEGAYGRVTSPRTLTAGGFVFTTYEAYLHGH